MEELPPGTKVRFNQAFFDWLRGDAAARRVYAQMDTTGTYVVRASVDRNDGDSEAYGYFLKGIEGEGAWHEDWLEVVPKDYCNCRNDSSFTPQCLDCVLKYYP